MQPVGPEEPQTYWIRRAIVGGGIVLVLFLFWFIFLRSSGSEPTADPQPVPAASESSRPSASPSSSSSRSPGGACTDEDIEVTVVTDKESYSSGESPKITMSISNTSDTPCERDVGSKSNEIMISSGGVQVYSTDACSSSDETDEVTLEPDQRANVTVQWDRTSTAAGCGTGETVSSGSYDAVGRNGDVESEESTFVLQ